MCHLISHTQSNFLALPHSPPALGTPPPPFWIYHPSPPPPPVRRHACTTHNNVRETAGTNRQTYSTCHPPPPSGNTQSTTIFLWKAAFPSAQTEVPVPSLNARPEARKAKRVDFLQRQHQERQKGRRVGRGVEYCVSASSPPKFADAFLILDSETGNRLRLCGCVAEVRIQQSPLKYPAILRFPCGDRVCVWGCSWHRPFSCKSPTGVWRAPAAECSRHSPCNHSAALILPRPPLPLQFRRKHF